MKKSYVHPSIEIQFSVVEQMVAISIREGNATDDDALVKSYSWDIWGDENSSEE